MAALALVLGLPASELPPLCGTPFIPSHLAQGLQKPAGMVPVFRECVA